jgi:Transposase DDE domain
MVAHATSCLRRLGDGRRCREVQFWRFVANSRVTVERLLEGWGARSAQAAAGRHVLAIQDTTEINFATEPGRRRGLGKIAKGNTRGLLVHAMAAVDATSGSLLGLVTGRIWTRKGVVRTAHALRDIKNKESGRWLSTAETAKRVLAKAGMVTVIADRESDIYAEWALVPAPNFHLITRVWHDRRRQEGGKLSDALEEMADAGTRTITLPARAPNAPERKATLTLRFGPVTLKRPDDTMERNLPATVTLSVVEVLERHPPKGQKPLHWRLLTTHGVVDEAAAWQIVDWYRMRWIIEQLFRLMKSQGLDIEASQITEADRLLKLAAIVAHAAAVTLQLVQARDGKSQEMADIAFSSDEIGALDTLDADYKGTTKLQTNPHRKRTLAWAAWLIARLGGWDGYPSSKRPGPITFRHGLEYFKAFAAGYARKDVCMP